MAQEQLSSQLEQFLALRSLALWRLFALSLFVGGSFGRLAKDRSGVHRTN